MSSEVTPDGLNSSHIRAIGCMLRLVEQTVDHIERLLTEPVARITTSLTDDLDAEERRAIHAACARLRATLIEACRRLGIEVAERSRRRRIRGEISTLWAMLEDTKSPSLRGYGPISPGAGAIVDELLEEINVNLNRILRVVAESRPDVATRV